ncbi:MAG: LPS assembly lipoprotein LptE [Hasllibacter sp.]
MWRSLPLLALLACAPLPEGPPLLATPADPESRIERVFLQALERRLDGPGAVLAYGIETREIGVAFTGGGETQRAQVEGSVDWRWNGLTGRETAFTGYSTTGTPVATDAARRDAEDRLMEILAQRVEAALRLRAGIDAPGLGPLVAGRPGAGTPPGTAPLAELP